MTQWLGHHGPTDRDVFLLDIDSFGSPLLLPEKQGRYFICFCAGDASGLPADVLGEFCLTLLRGGCVYFCAWGLRAAASHYGRRGSR